MRTEPIFDVAQLGHLEIYSPKVEESVKFFHEILGMTVVHEQGDSVYMRAYEDMYHNTLKITANDEPGVAHIGFRTTSENALHRRIEELEKDGHGGSWNEGDIGHGPGYEFKLPGGHTIELYWETDYYEAPEDQKTPLLNRPQKKPNVGVPVRRLDHVNILAKGTRENSLFLDKYLGFNIRERVIADDNNDIAAWLSVSNLAHDIAVMEEPTETESRLHHICYWYGYPQNLTDVADLLIERGYELETGPLKHGVSQAACLYVFEPGGNRVELFGDAGYLIFDPEWKTVEWKGEDLQNAVVWHGSQLPEDFFSRGTPERQPSKVEVEVTNN